MGYVYTMKRVPVKKSSISDVARAAGVSKTTVSRVLNSVQNVDPVIEKRVRAAMEELNYVPRRNRLRTGHQADAQQDLHMSHHRAPRQDDLWNGSEVLLEPVAQPTTGPRPQGQPDAAEHGIEGHEVGSPLLRRQGQHLQSGDAP